MRHRSDRVLLIAIAVGLWANVALGVLTPMPLNAQGSGDTERYLSQIAKDVRNISNGVCLNAKIC